MRESLYLQHPYSRVAKWHAVVAGFAEPLHKKFTKREFQLYDPKFHPQRNTIIMDDWRIEKMARALCAHNKEDPDGIYTAIEDGFPVQRPRWWRYMDQARTALEAHEGNYRPSPGSV